MAKLNLGAKVDKLHSLDAVLKAKKREVEKLDEQVKELKDELAQLMARENVDKASGKVGTVTLTSNIIPSVSDWDDFYAYIHKHKYYHLLERRPAVAGCREIFERKGKIPGVVPFEKFRVNVS